MTRNVSAVPRTQRSPSTRISLLEDVRETENAEARWDFVDRYTPLIYGYCRQRKLQESDARDVTQNVFFAVSRAIGSFEYDCNRGRFRSWLGTITCREIRRYLIWVNRFGSRTNAAGPSILTLDQDLESNWETAFTTYLFQHAMSDVRPTFPEDVWQAFNLTWLHDEAPADVAEQVERPVAWVYKAKFRVLKRLRAEVETLADDIPVRPK